MEPSLQKNIGNLVVSTCSTTPVTSSYIMSTKASAQESSGTPITTLALTGASNSQANYKTKDGLIRMLLQTATPSITPQQHRYLSNQEKNTPGGTESSMELKMHGGSIGHYNNGHITQPHPSAVHPLPRTPVQINSSSITKNLLGHIGSPTILTNPIDSTSGCNSEPNTGSSQTITSNTISPHLMKIDIQGQSSITRILGSSNAITSPIFSEKPASSSVPPSVTQANYSNTLRSSDINAKLHDEAPYRFIHQISEFVSIVNRQVSYRFNGQWKVEEQMLGPQTI